MTARGLVVDRARHTASVDGEELSLTPTEFRLLWTLMRQPGRPFSRHELMDASRGEDANALERTIDVHVRSLRQKLGPHAEMLETVRGIGYRFRVDRADGEPVPPRHRGRPTRRPAFTGRRGKAVARLLHSRPVPPRAHR